MDANECWRVPGEPIRRIGEAGGDLRVQSLMIVLAGDRLRR
jgi:hypothetical protein